MSYITVAVCMLCCVNSRTFNLYIEAALKCLALPLTVRDTIRNSYKNLLTDSEHRVSTTKITLKHGDKQGGLLSPFIYNIILDPLLELEQRKRYKFNDISASTLPDDLVLLPINSDYKQYFP